ncbi:FAD-dependent monooxygenase [Lentzea sp. NBRC 102530]|uniref:FAD-dependent monooxygenase n=1 Tax=Lentzea sp. NBRC 102530 TaxID=3032201 RepID=UPI0024A31858|nr:FAD-dependent monooxygenase [Lentzea sp. NBRC 102530]GLY46857.1 putative oxygenase [Lentzea sp. NBRC 102530]
MDAAVIVVGAGPAGLMLAGELRLAGVGVLVLDRLDERTGQSRGIGATTRTVEILDERGLLGRFGPLDTANFGHFGGVPLDLSVLGAAHEPAKTVPQSQIELVLEKWAVGLGADLRRGHEVVGLTQDDDGAEVTVSTVDGERTLRARFVVGCDGGRSAVRKLAGFGFPGTDARRELLLADVRDIEVAPRMTGEKLERGMVLAGRMPDGTTRLVVSEYGVRPRPRHLAAGFSDVADAWLRVTGEDVSAATPLWASAFGDAARQADRYRIGRVLLAGDAAHIHLAAGGQGMNTSIQDSVNLGWKLAAVVRGRAPEELLDTYHDERHPVGARLLQVTRAQGELMLSGPEVVPLRSVIAELSTLPEVHAHLAAVVSGLEIRYDVGTGTNPLLGRRMPRWRVGDGTTTELLRAGRGVLLDLTGNAVLRDLTLPWTNRIDVVTAGSADRGATTAVLIRPDGHVAWAAPGTHHDLRTALTRWFGPSR